MKTGQVGVCSAVGFPDRAKVVTPATSWLCRTLGVVLAPETVLADDGEMALLGSGPGRHGPRWVPDYEGGDAMTCLSLSILLKREGNGL